MNEAWRRLKREKLALVCLTVIALYLLTALLCKMGLIFTGFDLVNDAIAYQPPTPLHIFGTDLFGRDVLSRAAHGIVTSLTIGILSAGLASLIGTMLGALAGYFGGKTDMVIVWFYTTIDTIPAVLLLISLSMAMGSGLMAICLSIGLTQWIGSCRIIRAEFMKQRDREYVQGAKALGAGHSRRILNHILPNTFHLVIINFSLGFVAAVKYEVILTYLGLGLPPGAPSWGHMIADARLELSRGVWWGMTAATIFMFFLVLAFTLFNDALRDALDPKLKGRG